MARPRKCRKVCSLPKCNKFIPSNWDNTDTITLLIDEAEAIRLIDKEGLNQEEAASMMGVARTTVQQIYQDARVKIADAIIDGKALVIEGGDVELCPNQCCGSNKCYLKKKLVAIPVEKDFSLVCKSFARSPYYVVYDLEAKSYEFYENIWGSGIEVASALCEKNISYVITREIGEHVNEFFNSVGVKIALTDEKNLDTLIENIGDYIDE